MRVHVFHMNILYSWAHVHVCFVLNVFRCKAVSFLFRFCISDCTYLLTRHPPRWNGWRPMYDSSVSATTALLPKSLPLAYICGVSQWSVRLGPILFLLYTTDILVIIPKRPSMVWMVIFTPMTSRSLASIARAPLTSSICAFLRSVSINCIGDIVD